MKNHQKQRKFTLVFDGIRVAFSHPLGLTELNQHLSTYPWRQKKWTYHPLGLKLASVDVHFHYRKLIHFTNAVARGQRSGFWVLWRRSRIQARKRRTVESVIPAQNLAAEAGPSSQLVDLAHPNDLPIPVVHSEVRFSFNRDYHLLTFPISESHGCCKGL